MPFEDDEQAYLNDREMPDEADMDQDEATSSTPCPYCGKSVYEEAEVCNHCGSYISQEDAQRRRRWLRWGLVLLVSAVLALGYCRVKGLLYFWP